MATTKIQHHDTGNNKKIAHNNHLTKANFRVIAQGLRDKVLIGATDGTQKEGYQAGGWTLYN